MEPLSIITISAAVGGAAGKLIEKAWDSGEKWLASYFKDHHAVARDAARANSLEFLNDLAQRVHELEAGAKDDARKQQIRDALQDPDFSALLKDSLIASSRTASEEKHRILARIVSERVRSESEGLVALTSGIACEAVKYLTPKHIRFLGIATLTYYIRPIGCPSTTAGAPSDELYAAWLTDSLSPYLPFEPMGNLDFLHLESLSCIRYDAPFTRKLERVLSPPDGSGCEWSYEEFVQDNAVGTQLHDIWESGMQSTVLTTAGQLIGIYVHDELTGTTTELGW
ncbi:MAG: LPO_1073/Vpar_1526 family protein [Anaerolineae bacterium]